MKVLLSISLFALSISIANAGPGISALKLAFPEVQSVFRSAHRVPISQLGVETLRKTPLTDRRSPHTNLRQDCLRSGGYQLKTQSILFPRHDSFLPNKHLGVRHYSTDRFLDPKNDIAFKKLFATEDHKPLLMSFLNSMLRLEGIRTIKKVELLPTEQIPLLESAKRSLLDVKCTDQRNIQYIVEMQNEKLANFIKRSQFYVANAYVSQLGKAMNYIHLKPVVLLAIVDDVLFPKKPEYISYHNTLDVRTHERDLEDLSYAFVELPKFKKTEHELKTPEDKWLYLFRNAQEIKAIPKDSPGEIQEAYKTLEEFNWTSGEREAYFKANMAVADELDALRTATEKGRTEGIFRERNDIALKLLAFGEQDEKILKITNITSQELDDLKRQIEKK